MSEREYIGNRIRDCPEAVPDTVPTSGHNGLEKSFAVFHRPIKFAFTDDGLTIKILKHGILSSRGLVVA